MSSTPENILSWYVVHTHPKQEERTAINLQSWGMETLSPKLQVSRCNEFSGRVTRLVKPMFPSYIFARFKFAESLHRVRFTRGVTNVVTFNDKPTPVEDEIVNLIRARIGADGFVKTSEDLKAGDEVVINHGRFHNFCGVFEREMQDTDRVRILLNTVSFQAHVVVDKVLVTRVARNNDHTSSSTPDHPSSPSLPNC